MKKSIQKLLSSSSETSLTMYFVFKNEEGPIIRQVDIDDTVQIELEAVSKIP